jgi:hypothetical protein
MVQLRNRNLREQKVRANMAAVTSGKSTAFLALLRAVAIVLVVNSHLDDLYPIPQLGTGGMFGNELFFFVSGYGLFLSYNKSHEPIGGWLIRRIIRVYEPLFVVATFLVLIGDIQVHSVSDFFWLYVVSTPFWFLPAITACYIPIYLVMSLIETKKRFLYLLTILGVAYLLIFFIFAEKTEWITENYSVQPEVTVPLRMIYYFSTMVLGVYAARFYSEISGDAYDLLWLLVSAAGYYLFVASLGRFVPFQLQIIDRIPALVFLVFAFRLAHHPWLGKFVDNHLSGVVALLAGVSLQIYLIHDYILHFETLRAIAFPANLVVFALATLALSVLFEKIHFRRQSKGQNVRHLEGSAAVSQTDSSISVPATVAFHRRVNPLL